MAGKVKRMSTIKQLVQLHLSGVSNRQIALRLNMYKATVNNYVQKIRNESLSPRELLELDDPVLEKRFLADFKGKKIGLITFHTTTYNERKRGNGDFRIEYKKTKFVFC